MVAASGNFQKHLVYILEQGWFAVKICHSTVMQRVFRRGGPIGTVVNLLIVTIGRALWVRRVFSECLVGGNFLPKGCD
jgi:hypothetical protein